MLCCLVRAKRLRTYGYKQRETQVIVQIDVLEGVKVAHVVCEVENSSVLIGITGETSRKCLLFVRVRPELSK